MYRVFWGGGYLDLFEKIQCKINLKILWILLLQKFAKIWLDHLRPILQNFFCP